MKVDDHDVERYLRIFTFLDIAEIDRIIAEHKATEEVTELVHGEHGLRKAQLATGLLFGTSLPSVSTKELVEAFEHDPRLVPLASTTLMETPLDQLVRMIASAHKLIQSGGLYLNHRKITDARHKITHTDLLDGHVCVVRTGKSNYHIIVAKPS
ncbi:hypothetical protein SYNPS1DRAFT_22336 [Syncephalis pseudoplumigaleata]|uniref:Tyrosine--tRNA ligase SYY-like C-terminal domain-containing protein n=1 Tax=Syncephalis pseudoplumigaleata TaxID=1712513 RepID=A0A4P9YZY9_9FUNG|nr:hypothetical protein SYNPS1DRAFT_22336 [Syncephalis pseudoplumigaleata]|eukprot:RKP25763.1 hypothetical protein SYNPS1DRAFT_22336 [Syncephalis pseudoplumigaleata]